MTIESTPTRRLQADWPVDVLGVLTIAVYGSWYYGFGVLIDDIGAGLDVGSRGEFSIASALSCFSA